MIANLIDAARGLPVPAQVTTGETIHLPSVTDFQQLMFSTPLDTLSTGTNLEIQTFDQTIDPGLYHFTLVDASGRSTEYDVGSNRGDLEESNLTPQAWTYDSNTTINGTPGITDPMMPLSPWLLALAVLLLLLETGLAWH